MVVTECKGGRVIRLIASLWRGFTHAFAGWTGIALAGMMGVLLGVGVFTLQYSGVTSYLGDDPATCANCHAMQEEYEGWQRGSHHATPAMRRTTISSTSTSTRRTTASGTR